VPAQHQKFRLFVQKCHGPQNILLFEYLNMQFIPKKKEKKNKASAFKQQQKTVLF